MNVQIALIPCSVTCSGMHFADQTDILFLSRNEVHVCCSINIPMMINSRTCNTQFINWGNSPIDCPNIHTESSVYIMLVASISYILKWADVSWTFPKIDTAHLLQATWNVICFTINLMDKLSVIKVENSFMAPGTYIKHAAAVFCECPAPYPYVMSHLQYCFMRHTRLRAICEPWRLILLLSFRQSHLEISCSALYIVVATDAV